MADNSSIQWTDATWSPATGCDRVSPGCDNCYALTLARRLKAMGSAKYQTDGDPRTSGPGFGVAMHPDTLTIPAKWRDPRMVFVNSMSDLFHPRITDEFIADVFATMAATPRHTYQVLTKRAPRMASLLGSERFLDLLQERAGPMRDRPMGFAYPLSNVWLGVSVEDQQRAHERIHRLRRTPAVVRFLSCEPLLGPVNLNSLVDGATRLDGRPQHSSALTEPCPDCGGWGTDCGIGDYHFTRRHDGIGWVIIGGESGRGARRMQLSWAQDLVDQCRAAGVPVFVKQLGSVFGPAHHGRTDADLAAWPAALRVRQFPAVEERVS